MPLDHPPDDAGDASRAPRRVVQCGMYADSEAVRQAWQALFRQLSDPLSAAESGHRLKVVFDGGESWVHSPGLLLAHTCGYPLVTRLHPHYAPVCVPVFELDGCRGSCYSSWLITGTHRRSTELAAFAGAVVGVNATDSNSGMNVLRYAIARLNPARPFFKRVVITGAHRSSMEAVAAGRIDLAAIDAVSYRLVLDQQPGLERRLHIIGQSEYTAGLPFVMPKTGHIAADRVTAGLNRALELTPELHRLLRITAFRSVTLADYDKIRRLQAAAIQAGYAHIG